MIYIPVQIFLSTPSGRRATEPVGFIDPDNKISIHALREEGDEPFIAQITASSLFLSTPSARRATVYHIGDRVYQSDFYPRPPRGGRRFVSGWTDGPEFISIHALREEGDQ